MRLIDSVRAGDRVTIIGRAGQQQSGRAVMRCIAGGWVLHLDSRGMPGIAQDDNTVRVSAGRGR